MLQTKKLLRLSLYSLLLISNIMSQPYIYYKENVVDTIRGRLAYDIQKLDLNTNIKRQFLANAGCVDLIKWDETQSWLIIGNYELPNYAINCNDTTKGFYLPADIGGIGAILYCESNGRLFVFSSIINSNEAGLSVFDISTQERVHFNTIPYRKEKFNVLNEEAFFSQNEDFIYFSLKDSLTGENKVMKFSTSSYGIVEINSLSNLGFPNADGYILHRGVAGKGIIKSFFRNSDKEQYYKVMDFDSGLSYALIYSQGFFIPYLLGLGKYLVLEEIIYNSINSNFYCSGKVNIYDGDYGELITTLQLEPNSKLFVFDDYPNKLYSVNSNSEAYTINIDSLADQNLLVTLTNSEGTQLPPSSVQYYDTSWKDAVDNGDGTFTVLTTKPTVSLRMFYEYASQTVHNVPAQNNTYTFQTVNAAVQLQNSQGSLIDQGTVQYYAGALERLWNNCKRRSNKRTSS